MDFPTVKKLQIQKILKAQILENLNTRIIPDLQ